MKRYLSAIIIMFLFACGGESDKFLATENEGNTSVVINEFNANGGSFTRCVGRVITLVAGVTSTRLNTTLNYTWENVVNADNTTVTGTSDIVGGETVHISLDVFPLDVGPSFIRFYVEDNITKDWNAITVETKGVDCGALNVPIPEEFL